MPTLDQVTAHLNPQRSKNPAQAINDSLVSLAFEFPEFSFNSTEELRAILIVMYDMTPGDADDAIGRYLYADAT